MRTLLALLCFSTFLLSQPAQVQVNADCVIAFVITAQNGTGPASGSFDNRQVGCNSWQLQYGSTGFSGVALAVQSATDAVTFGTMGGTVTLGANPLTSTTGASNLLQAYSTSFAPYVRVQATTATGTGTIRGILLGFRAAGSAGTSGGGTSGAVNVTQIASSNVPATTTVGAMPIAGRYPTGGTFPNLVVDSNGTLLQSGLLTTMADGISNQQTVVSTDQNPISSDPSAGVYRTYGFTFNGSTWDRQFTCPSQAQVALSGTGYTQIVAASGSTVIRVCKVFVTSVSGGNPVVNTFNIAFGTCAGSPTQIFTAGGVTGFDEDFGGSLRSAASGALCVKESTANSDLVTVTYVQY